MSRVSVIVPIYNAEKVLEKCIKSILGQTFDDFELILVNDGSKDRSPDICEKYSAQDRRIKVIHKQNEGHIMARQTGLEATSSEYVTFVDADDWLDSAALEILYREAVGSNADVTVCCSYKVIGGSTLIKQKHNNDYFIDNKLYTNEDVKNKLVEAYLFGHPFPGYLWGKLYKRELLLSSGKYMKHIKFLFEDVYYNMEMLLKSNKVKLIDAPLYYYRAGGTTSKYMSFLFDDMIAGYKIQKEVIEQYFVDTKQKQYKGISIMLLNTLQTCLYNLFVGNLGDAAIRQKIGEYVSNESVLEALSNKDSHSCFDQQYLNAIKNKNIDYLYNMGRKIYNKRKYKRLIMNLATKMLSIG